MVSLFAVTVVVAMSFDLVGRFVGYCDWLMFALVDLFAVIWFGLAICFVTCVLVYCLVRFAGGDFGV